MKPEFEKYFTEGDFFLKEAKSKFYLQKEEHCTATSGCCNAVKKYLDAYEKFLFEGLKPSNNYHVLLHMISQRDPDFIKFSEKIFEVKCFADESKLEGEKFFLYPDEINDVLKIVLDLRNYIAEKMDLKKVFMEEYIDSSFMGT